MKFSVAMCTYNGAAFLQAQLDSIGAQTRPPDELVVCDDRSSDRTTEIVEGFASRAPFPVRLYVNERNLGSTENFERAIGLCGGAVIALADQDDVWHADKLRRVEEVFAAMPEVGLVFTDAEVVDEQLRPSGLTLWQATNFSPREQKLIREGKAVKVLLKHNVVFGTTMAFRAAFKEVVLPIRTRNFHIHDGWIALIIAGVADVAIIPTQLIKYRQHAKQQIGADSHSLPKPSASLATARQIRVDAFLDMAGELGQVYERLRAAGAGRRAERALSHVEAKMAHLQSRAAMPERRLRRVGVVLRELLTFRYHQYSKGVYSAARDLL